MVGIGLGGWGRAGRVEKGCVGWRGLDGEKKYWVGRWKRGRWTGKGGEGGGRW